MSKDTRLSNEAPLAAERAQASGAASGRLRRNILVSSDNARTLHTSILRHAKRKDGNTVIRIQPIPRRQRSPCHHDNLGSGQR
jgi:hypothetical protein